MKTPDTQRLTDMEKELSLDKEEYGLTKSTKLLKRIHHYENAITQLEQEVEAIGGFDRSCGHLWVASSERVHSNGHFLDWAFDRSTFPSATLQYRKCSF
jgi:hypothetical protein